MGISKRQPTKSYKVNTKNMVLEFISGRIDKF
nr:MAG TPA: hypothetical protein [Caudoviricetes sp.]